MNIVLVPKSGDLSKSDNYRGISLICIIAKIFDRLIFKADLHTPILSANTKIDVRQKPENGLKVLTSTF